jgi:hypothetical protein
MNGRETTRPVPLEHFIQALTTQLDRAQAAMSIKARTMDLPLTFALKDLTLDLRTHVEVEGSVVKIRPAGPGDTTASTIRLALTTITRPMIDENTLEVSADPGEPDLKEAVGEELSSDDLRRLEWAGVQTVSQLRKLQAQAGEQAIERIADVPALRLRAALSRAAQPMVHEVIAQPPSEGQPDQPPVYHLRGHNLLREGGAPLVRLGNESLRVLRATPRELVVAPTAQQLGGTIEIETGLGYRVTCALPSNGGGQP